ncbi:hypothetical protein [Ramlibacter sp. Leaf400]|uniref:hypothetical protein n=1 Tax=Ramlibacter sp. Leaf400 TaxID=1736365 RepID=UPI0012E38AE4|nr:hypothetical protein [Ramlibacter sp. Leaf400]
MTRRVLLALLLLGLAAGLVGAAAWAYEAWRDRVLEEGDRRGEARVQARWDEDRARAQEAALDKARQDAAETLRRLNQQQENERAQQALLAQLARDRDAARAAADGLRLRAAAYLDAAGCGHLAGDSALGCVREAAAEIGIALSRSAQIAQRVAADADEARSRGLRCEADYDALTLRLSML